MSPPRPVSHRRGAEVAGRLIAGACSFVERHGFMVEPTGKTRSSAGYAIEVNVEQQWFVGPLLALAGLAAGITQRPDLTHPRTP